MLITIGESGLMDAVYMLIKVGGLALVAYIAYFFTKDSSASSIKSYFVGLCVAFGLAFMSWVNYGTHQEGGDYLFDSGETVVDFEPSEEERLNRGIYSFVTFGGAIIFGVYLGLKANSK